MAAVVLACCAAAALLIPGRQLTPVLAQVPDAGQSP
jgi:hypothetical protein